MNALLIFAGTALFAGFLIAQDLQPQPLPKPMTEGGKPLMQCLKERRTTREFSAEVVKPQILSNLLWAACGINRDDGHRTAPSAMNNQETDIYVFLAEGIYRYDAQTHALTPVQAGDCRAAAGRQEFVKDAPVNLVYVADLSKMGDMSASDKDLYSAADVGFIAQNVYLYCASEGLDCVVQGWIDRDQLAQTLKLTKNHKVILAQTVGYPWK
jgi:SagB-type dehydrogenase family enzyme